MFVSSRLVLLGVVSVLALVTTTTACGGGGSNPNGSSGTTPEIVSPTSGLTVRANIASATLADERASSNLQIAFNAAAGSQPAHVEIVNVSLTDSSGTVIESLTASKPQIWNGTGYVFWNQDVTPGGDLKASYALTSPGWSKMDKANDVTGTGPGSKDQSSYSRTFKLEVTVRIDGLEVIIRSESLNREPLVQT